MHFLSEQKDVVHCHVSACVRFCKISVKLISIRFTAFVCGLSSLWHQVESKAKNTLTLDIYLGDMLPGNIQHLYQDLGIILN